MSLDLSAEVENTIQERASAQGVSVDELLKRTFAPEGQTPPPMKDPKKHVASLLARWQANENTPTLPPIPTLPGETPSEALFRRWEEEDSNMTEEEIEADLRSWDEFRKGMDETREALGMRRLRC